jgi:hypothetical protein
MLGGVSEAVADDLGHAVKGGEAEDLSGLAMLKDAAVCGVRLSRHISVIL